MNDWRWPEWTRVAGFLVGTYGTFVADSADKASILAFAGALLMAPNIAGVQRKRNEKRDDL